MVSSFDPEIQSKGFFFFAVFMLCSFVFCIALASSLPLLNKLGMGFVSLSFGTLMLVRFKSIVHGLSKITGIARVLGLFIVINVMERKCFINHR